MIQRPFEISAMTLAKFGWESAKDLRGSWKNLPTNAIWFFEKKDPFLAEPITYYIQEISLDRNLQFLKQIEYRFKSYKTSTYVKGKQKISMIDDIEIKSNVELFKKIIETEACQESYIRHFKINRLLK